MAIINFKPPFSLNAFTDKEVKEITNLLKFDSSQNSSRKTNEWLQRQESKVKRLKNEDLLRPDCCLYKGVRKLFYPQTLCQAHKELDHNVIRSLLWSIAYESTAQTNIYRVLRIKGKFKFNIERRAWMTKEQLKLIQDEEDMINANMEEWLDLTNEMTALWLGERKYRELCGSKKRDFLPGCAKTGCEACMLAAVGGNCHYLTALRANLLARHLYKTDQQEDKKKEINPPSLLRVVDAWISKAKDSRNTPLMNSYSKELARSLVGMRILATRLEDEHIERRRNEGKKPGPRWGVPMVTWTADQLPIPIKHKHRVKPARKDKVTVDWTTELTRGFRAAMENNDETCSVRMSGAIRTDGAARINLARKARRAHPDGTSTLINFNDDDGDVPEPVSSRVSHLFNVGLEESESSWTSRVEDDEYDDDDDDDIYDDEEYEEYDVSPEASSVYSRDGRDRDGYREVSPEDPIVHSGDESDSEADYDSKALTRWKGNDEAASCFESMGWGGPKR
ncbi:hypothetical protein HDV63DRAFT_412200 [Trichoderma sp. SZMC 28014]